ncbi:MAG: hypothetical protein ACUVR3_03715 [Candidatus Roseilinea sp.]|uniref:hypothetical protein n=1 Tax=Candidatus Roseilinea sp. TaxID=2838777 RepID=UPI00404A92DE
MAHPFFQQRPKIDQLQGLREERQSAWNNAELLFQALQILDKRKTAAVRRALRENAYACAALELEILRLESLHD